MTQPTLTDRQRRVLIALAAGLNGQSSATDIAHRLGYRPAISGRLAVTSTLHRMIDRETHCGLFVNRLPPRDRWESATWCITQAGRRAIEDSST